MAKSILGKNIEQVKMERIKPFPGNPRHGDVDSIRESIRANGFFTPLIVQKKTGYIIVGNHRFEAGKAEGMTVFPVCYVEVTDDRAKRMLLADNAAADLGTFDDDALVAMLQTLGKDLEGTLYRLDDEAGGGSGESPEVQFSQEIGEANNYVVLLFRTEIDWLQALSVLGLKTVKALDSKKGFEKRGIGRVVDGPTAMALISEGGGKGKK